MCTLNVVLECSFLNCKTRVLKSNNGKVGQLKMKRCALCKTQYYCSTDCQKSDWKFHKAICNRNDVGKKICEGLQTIFVDLLNMPDFRQILLSSLKPGEVFPEVVLEYTGKCNYFFLNKKIVAGALAAAALETVLNIPTDFLPNELLYINSYEGPLFTGSLSQTPGSENQKFIVVTFLYPDCKDSRSCIKTSIEIPRSV